MSQHIFKAENYIEHGLSLGIFKSQTSETESTHTHDFIEIIYVSEGHSTHTVNGVEYSLGRGDMLFINYASTHSFATDGSFTYYNISFSPEVIAERIINRENAFDLLSLTAINEIRSSDNLGCKISFNAEDRIGIEAILSDMHSEYISTLPERRAVLESYMTIIIAKILRRFNAAVVKKSESSGISRDILDFIDSNLGERLTLSALAKKCFYNPSYFSRSFKEQFGVTLVEYISRARANAAARLICESDMSTSDIAEECGFSDKSALYRAFAKYYGMTPKEYRLAHKEKA